MDGNSRNLADTLANSPIDDLSINAHLKRALNIAHCSSLMQAFQKEDELESSISNKAYAELIMLYEDFISNPNAFIRKVSTKNDYNSSFSDSQKTNNIPSSHDDSKPNKPKKRKPLAPRRAILAANPELILSSILENKSGKFLLEIDDQAKAEFELLFDRNEEVLIYQIFPKFESKLEDICNEFINLFQLHRNNKTQVLKSVEKLIPYTFMIFTAYRARTVFSGDNLWGNFFSPEFDLPNNLQIEYKQTFLDYLQKLEMPVYGKDDETFYYYFTTLLHGGLSLELWCKLWKSSLLPYAKTLNRRGVTKVNGEKVLSVISTDNSKYYPGKTAANILEKAPKSTLAPIFESALEIAREATSENNANYLLLDGAALPEVALASLEDELEKQSSIETQKTPGNYQKEHRPAVSEEQSKHRGSKSETGLHLIILPHADLCLKVETGSVVIKWPEKLTVADLAGSKIEYFVNGTLVYEQSIEKYKAKAIIREVEKEVEPQIRIDVELRILCPSTENGTEESFEKIDSFHQTFFRRMPGCLEFIKAPNGIYYLRNPNKKITSEKSVAYLMEPDYFIEPGNGMFITGEIVSGNGAKIILYDVQPGSNGAIFKKIGTSREEVAAWHESFLTTITKHHAIGKTIKGMDLYGYVPCKGGDNGGLPEIVIEPLGENVSKKDFSIECTCDGNKKYVPMDIVHKDGADESSSIIIKLRLERVDFPLFAETIDICVRQKSAENQKILRYKFAVIPIEWFRLESAHYENRTLIANYSFRCKQDINVTESNGDTKLLKENLEFYKRALLKDESMYLKFSSAECEKELEAELFLAAIDITLPDKLIDISESRPICLADALTLGSSQGEVKVSALDSQRSRGVFFFQKGLKGNSPLMIAPDIIHAKEYSFNIFNNPENFMQYDETPGDRSLSALVSFGYEMKENMQQRSSVEINLLNCIEGFGFSKVELRKDEENVTVHLDNPTQCDLHVGFERQIGHAKSLNLKPISDADLDITKNSDSFGLPEKVVDKICEGKTIFVVFTPIPWFGGQQKEYSIKYRLAN
jgi:hypothetical protein